MQRWSGCLVLVWPALASAHQGTGAHGGLVADAGPYYAELTLQENRLQFFVFDDRTDAPVPIGAASPTATVLVGQETQTVTLRPGPSGTGDNVMVGQLEKNAGAGARIVVLIQLPGKPSIVARFAF
ncbi:MAG: hypothetical protein WA459_12140 [Stellaceae bacterium]